MLILCLVLSQRLGSLSYYSSSGSHSSILKTDHIHTPIYTDIKMCMYKAQDWDWKSPCQGTVCQESFQRRGSFYLVFIIMQLRQSVVAPLAKLPFGNAHMSACPAESQLLCLQSSFLLMHPGRQKIMVQVLGYLPHM